jgi:AraC-like DNA-binding protein
VASIHFPYTSILLNQVETWIDVPRSFLALPRQITNAPIPPHPTPSRTTGEDDLAGFIHALRRKLREHSGDGYPDVDAAAQSVCMSVRTLQRNLARAGVTYSKVLEHARLEAATEMLATPGLKIIEIAYSLGYEDPSHFSRAFRRLVGQSPREFRIRQLAKATAA